MFQSFFHDHLQEVLRCALCRYNSFRLFAFLEFVLLGSMWSHVYVICACLVFLSVGDLLVRWQHARCDIEDRMTKAYRIYSQRNLNSITRFKAQE